MRNVEMSMDSVTKVLLTLNGSTHAMKHIVSSTKLIVDDLEASLYLCYVKRGRTKSC